MTQYFACWSWIFFISRILISWQARFFKEGMDKCISGFLRFHAANLEREWERPVTGRFQGSWPDGSGRPWPWALPRSCSRFPLILEEISRRCSVPRSPAAYEWSICWRALWGQIGSSHSLRRYMRSHSYVTLTHHRYWQFTLCPTTSGVFNCYSELTHARPGKPALLSWVVLENLETSLNCLCVPGKLGVCHTLFSKWAFLNSK